MTLTPRLCRALAGFTLAILFVGCGDSGGSDSHSARSVPAVAGLSSAFMSQSPADIQGAGAFNDRAAKSKDEAEQWSRNLPIEPGRYTCRLVVRSPEAKCQGGSCPEFVTGQGLDSNLRGVISQARTEAQSKLPSGCAQQQEQMWCRYGASPPFIPRAHWALPESLRTQPVGGGVAGSRTETGATARCAAA